MGKQVDAKIWTHRPAPIGFDLKAAKFMFETIAAQVLADHESPVDFGPHPAYPDGRYKAGDLRAAWMVFLEREFQTAEQESDRLPIELPCATCADSGVVSTTDKDHEGNHIEMCCPDCAERIEGLSQELADAPPVWLDDIDLFTARLYQAGWRDYADAQHEGIKEMFDEAWAMRPAKVKT